MMVANPYTGDAPITVDGQRLTLCFDWAALARIRSELGAEGQAMALSGDLAALADMVAIGLSRHHPDWDDQRVFAASPPVNPSVDAVQAALVAAYFGPQGAPKEPEPANPPMPPQTRLSRLWRRLTGRG
ncbi:hypothetical protein A6A04_13470 [Paramagnetospirillum marisnigri]|uniref:Uncharacterized protein n=1 Tax=Paramagnetospirillum marisnigri TaxID=1285242 RepID=A0A178MWX6_9PROT|nr:hypothetical protein [Paramagnetospirillum marisnigri]OAN53896.1 hypothetical protein A6A04_13470 [Paramagnetospirillum marisnigri]